MLKTLFEKAWESHVVAEQPDSPAILSSDLHLVHEVTSPPAFTGLRQRGLKVRRPEHTVATMDYSIPTTAFDMPIADPLAAAQIQRMEANATEFGITLHGMASPHRGIVHGIGLETHRRRLAMTVENPTAELTIVPASQTLSFPGNSVTFPIDPFNKTCLLDGVDELGYILSFEKKIAAFEAKR
jgi:hypothetical protein